MSEAAPSVLAEFDPEFAKHHGCAWFVFGGDRMRDPNQAGGWASIGGLPAFAFKSWKELPGDVTFWTNLSKAEAWTLGRWSRFKENTMFGVDWTGWLAEQGTLSAETLPDLVAGISETFARTAYSLSLWCQGRAETAPWSFGEGTLADALAERLGMGGEEPSPQPILQAAYRDIVQMMVPPQELSGKRKLVVSLPRYQHGQALGLARVPVSGQWSLLDMGAFPGSPHHAARWLADQTRPLLVKIGEPFWRPDEVERGVFWMGNRGRRFAGAEFEPVWLTGEEALDLARFAEFQLLTVYAGAGWEPYVPSDPFDLSLRASPLAPWANSAQLRAASAWRALASPVRTTARRNKAFVSERSLWMRQVDRRLCFDAAFALERAGFRVLAYGEGQATVLLDPAGDPLQWGRALKAAGWCLPMGLARVLPLSSSESFEDFISVDHWIKRAGGTVSRWNIDRIVAPWASGSGSVRAVMQKAAKDLLDLDTSEVPEWKKPWTDQLQEQARRSVDRLKKQRATG